jgi:NTP pyrophosphatase (non-canonical NTP hydrolase)
VLGIRLQITRKESALTLDDYQRHAGRTAHRSLDTYPAAIRSAVDALHRAGKFQDARDLLHATDQLVWTAGLTGEAGEVSDYLKKVLGHGKPLEVATVKKELGDVLWYVAALAQSFGLSLSEIATANVEKLRARYPDGFTVQASAARADEQTPEQEAHAGAKRWSRVGYSECCTRQSPRGFVCTRAPNHGGEHLAADHSEIVDRWSDPEPAVEHLTYAVDANGSPVLPACNAAVEFSGCPTGDPCGIHGCAGGDGDCKCPGGFGSVFY